MRTKRVTAGSSRRRKAFEGSTTFKEALVVVQHDLRQAAETHPSDVTEFLSWVRKTGLTGSTDQILKKIDKFHKDVTASLRLYVGFVLRFHVYLRFIHRDGAMKLIPKYEGPRNSQLKARVKEGKLIPPPAEPDADVRDRFAWSGGIPEQIRRSVKKGSRILSSEQRKEDDAKLMERGMSEEEVGLLRAAQRRHACNPEDAKLRIVEVDSEDTSSVSRLLDVAYDPLSITFLLVRSRGQTRVMCLVGELVSDDEWNQMGVIHAAVHKVMWGKTPAGAPVDFEQFAQDIVRIPLGGKIPTNSVIDALVETGSKTDTTDIKRMEKRLQRAKSRADRVRRQIAF
jgi:hypothetical protein